MAEPKSNSITSEELARRVHRVVGRRIRSDSTIGITPANPILTPKVRSWTAHGYDFLIISLAIFIAIVCVLNLSIAGSWHERANQWEDRARWQRELHAWEQQLAKQDQQLESDCQNLAATLIVSHGHPEPQLALDHVHELRQKLREASLSLAGIRGGDKTPLDINHSLINESASLSIAALKSKRDQLIEQQYAVRSQLNPEHPTLQALEQQLLELDRQLANSEQLGMPSNTTDPSSRVQVIENKYLRSASSSPPSRAPTDHEALTPQFQVLQQRFEQLRSATENILRDIDLHQQSLQQSDIVRATAWEQVAKALRAMNRCCSIPAGLQAAIEKQDQLRTEPNLTPLSLVISIGLSLALAGTLVWYASHAAIVKPTKSADSSDNEKLNLDVVTKHLGCAPNAILAWQLSHTETTAESSVPENMVPPGKPLQQKVRFACECLLAATIAATVLLSLSHGQFGDWLLANPLTAWGRWLGN